jgi:hypothetical protein
MGTAAIKRWSRPPRLGTLHPSRRFHEAIGMKALIVCLGMVGLLSGCISSSNPPPPAKTTVVVPAQSGTTVVCQDGTKPPCN